MVPKLWFFYRHARLLNRAHVSLLARVPLVPATPAYLVLLNKIILSQSFSSRPATPDSVAKRGDSTSGRVL